jgi:hypothetical protein
MKPKVKDTFKCNESYVFKNNLNIFQINCQDKFLYINGINHLYIKYQIKFLVQNYFISSKINTIKKHFISPHLTFAQIL